MQATTACIAPLALGIGRHFFPFAAAGSNGNSFRSGIITAANSAHFQSPGGRSLLEVPVSANPIPNPELSITSKPNDTGLELRCVGRITSSTTQQLIDEVRPLLSAGINVVLDLTDVTFLDSSGLGALVRLYVSSKSNRCQFRVEKLNARIRELFSITRLGAVLMEGRDPDSAPSR